MNSIMNVEAWHDYFETRINFKLDFIWICDPNDPNNPIENETKYYIKKVEYDRVVLEDKSDGSCITIYYEDLYTIYDTDKENVPYIMKKIKSDF